MFADLFHFSFTDVFLSGGVIVCCFILYKYFQMQSQVLEAVKKLIPDAKIAFSNKDSVCPECKTTIISESIFCHMCSTQIRKTCAECKNIMPIDANFCYKCKSRMHLKGSSLEEKNNVK